MNTHNSGSARLAILNVIDVVEQNDDGYNTDIRDSITKWCKGLLSIIDRIDRGESFMQVPKG